MLRVLRKKSCWGGDFLKKHSPVIAIEIFEQHYKKINELLLKNSYKLAEKVGYEDYVFIKF